MQQKSNKNLSAKERILLYLEYKGCSQYDFSKKTGLSNGFLKSGSSVSSDNLKLLSNIYGDLNLIWVVTGEGSMLNKGDVKSVNQSIINGYNVQTGSNSNMDNRQYYSDSPDVLKAQIDERDRLLAEKEIRIKEKDAQINKLLSVLTNIK
jgi:hypothetical protein